MEKKMLSVRTVAGIIIGSALMFVLMRFIALPSDIPDTDFQIGIAVLSIFAAIFGPIAGFLIGFIGHTLVDLTKDGVWWSWVIADALYGLAIGVFWKFYRLEEGEFGIKQAVVFNGVQVTANIIAWVGIASTLDVLFFQVPSAEAYLQGLVAAALNILVVLILGTLLGFAYSKSRTKAGR